MMVMAENMLGWRMGHLHWALQGITGTRLAAKSEGTFGLGWRLPLHPLSTMAMAKTNISLACGPSAFSTSWHQLD